MSISSGDIKFFLSGGLTNNDPNFSLGGLVSTFFMSSRLFGDISADDASLGKTDFRCIYIENINDSDTFYDCYLSVTQISDGADIELGIETLNAKQEMIINNGTLLTSGSFIAKYYDLVTDDWIEFTVDHNFNLNNWASQFEISLRNINGLENVTVTGTLNVSNDVIFTIDFIGNSKNRYQEVIQIVSVSETFNVVGATITINSIVSGEPIMSTAIEIDVETTIPTGVIFNTLLDNESIFIGDLNSHERFPVWVKRITSSNTSALEGDGFTFKLSGEIS